MNYFFLRFVLDWDKDKWVFPLIFSHTALVKFLFMCNVYLGLLNLILWFKFSRNWMKFNDSEWLFELMRVFSYFWTCCITVCCQLDWIFVGSHLVRVICCWLEHYLSESVYTFFMINKFRRLRFLRIKDLFLFSFIFLTWWRIKHSISSSILMGPYIFKDVFFLILREILWARIWIIDRTIKILRKVIFEFYQLIIIKLILIPLRYLAILISVFSLSFLHCTQFFNMWGQITLIICNWPLFWEI